MKKITAFLLVAAMLLGLTACGQDSPAGTTAPTAPTSATTPTTDSDEPVAPEKLSEVYNIASYAGTPEEVIANRETIVATLNGVPLRNSTLQIFYWLDVYDFMGNFDVESSGLDISKPLHEQELKPGTWQHYFLGSALGSWNYHQALALVAQEESIAPLPYFQKLLDNLDDELLESAKNEGFESIDAMIQSDTGPGCTIEDYRTYRQIVYTAQSYCYTKLNAMRFTDQEVEDYFTDKEAYLVADGITKKSGDSHRVRHILVPIEPEQEATEADWEKCRQKAQAILDEWLAGEATEESFAALAMEKSEDPGSVNYGGLYQGLTEGTSFLLPFKNWYLDKNRQPGDCELIKTTAGYHVMYYSGVEPLWYAYCHNLMVSDAMEKLETAALEKYDAVIYYDKILLGEVSLLEDK